MTRESAIIDGNEAAARVAFRTNEVCAIYPITPSSPMGELADLWSSERRRNVWGAVPLVVEMQSEGGAAGAVHGALQGGALTTTFTASQGLLLMIPNMYKIAGELTPAVFHVAARSLACQGLSIFGDHSDVMAVRASGFAMLCSGSVQEVHDMALVAQAATLEARVPFLHFFDGFRTSHELNRIELLGDDDVRAMIPDALVLAHRARSLDPDRPVVRGTAQNPDTYFQSRETVNPYYEAAPGIVKAALDRFAALTGRQYGLFEYTGVPDAEHVIVVMGSGAETVRETVLSLNASGYRAGMVQVRLFRPFVADAFVAALPPTVRWVSVLDRTKEPGALGEPLYMDVVAAINEAWSGRGDGAGRPPRIVGGRYGLSSKEFTPAMVKAVLDQVGGETVKNHFTVGINDDVTHTSLALDGELDIEPSSVMRAVFFGLGADGTVSANKNTVKIIGDRTDLHAQGYFVYDSKKTGSRTVSHLRFGPEPVHAPYLISRAEFVACHQFQFLGRVDVLGHAAQGATFLLNSPHSAESVWETLPRAVQQEIVDKRLSFHVIDAYGVARDARLGARINTIMQTCFFLLTDLLPAEMAIEEIKGSIRKTYSGKGEEMVRRNFAAVDKAIAALGQVQVPAASVVGAPTTPTVPDHAPRFVREVTAMMMEGRGDELPVSALPADGTYPSGTAAWEKRNVSRHAPVWEPDLCIQCGHCSFVCPHSVLRSKFFTDAEARKAPEGFRTAALGGRGFPGMQFTIQVYAEDCTGCGLCVDVCPARNPVRSASRAINMQPKPADLTEIRDGLAYFESLPDNDRGRMDFSTVRGVQFLTPLFEFPGACAGCGETPYVRLLSQLFGDRLMVANATGCSSIYGGNLPTTPWSVNKEGRGPVWSNSLFEDNAEFGLGFRLAGDSHRAIAERLLRELGPQLGAQLVEEVLEAPQRTEGELRAQRARVDRLRKRLEDVEDERARRLLSVVQQLVRRSVWIVGGDGWAYDIGYGGLDHVLASGRNVNVLVMDTEVYSNTGGQMSKATPLAAVAKFSAAGKTVPKKDLALMAMSYGNVYVARIAMGANPQQTLLALREAEAYPGPSLVLAYSHCIAHGINMEHGLRQQKLAVECGYWPLLRYDPELRRRGETPLLLDSTRPRIPLRRYAWNELRYRMLAHVDERGAERLMQVAQEHVYRTWALYEQMATVDAPGGAGSLDN